MSKQRRIGGAIITGTGGNMSGDEEIFKRYFHLVYPRPRDSKTGRFRKLTLVEKLQPYSLMYNIATQELLAKAKLL